VRLRFDRARLLELILSELISDEVLAVTELVGTIRRECLDFLVPLTERHLREILTRWITHYNRGRPHSSLGPGLPDPPSDRVVAPNGHQLPGGHRVVATSILGGLHHEYRLEPKVA
jgi:putative transposase